MNCFMQLYVKLSVDDLNAETFKWQFTLNDGKQNDNNEEEKWEIEKNSENFIGITIRRFNLVTDTTTSSDTFVQVEHEALKW